MQETQEPEVDQEYLEQMQLQMQRMQAYIAQMQAKPATSEAAAEQPETKTRVFRGADGGKHSFKLKLPAHAPSVAPVRSVASSSPPPPPPPPPPPHRRPRRLNTQQLYAHHHNPVVRDTVVARAANHAHAI